MDISRIQNLKNQAISSLLDAKNAKELEKIRLAYLGRKGVINQLIKELPTLEEEKKKEIGRLLNDVKKAIEETISNQLSAISYQPSAAKAEWIDVTAPGQKPPQGYLHPQTLVVREIIDIFRQIGYQVAEGPEIETDWYNFGSLNIPKDHPARDTQMTFYLETKGAKAAPGEIVLRTQTSAMQARVMEKTKPPIRVIVPGKCFRYEQVDASHGFEFWQVEGFLVDKNIRLTDLFGTITYALKGLFGQQTKLKFACTNFPFVEPGVDAYIKCTLCQGKGCSFCKNLGWSEIMPAGMIHPFVLKSAGINPRQYTGFAFAIGLSRVINLKFGLEDLRLLTTPDLRILKQF